MNTVSISPNSITGVGKRKVDPVISAGMKISLRKYFPFVIAVLLLANVHAAETLPPAIKGFCDLAFAGAIAEKGQPFNATGAANNSLPHRRIVDYVIKDSYAYLWYEHGGKGYHQHLVKFSKTPPYELKKSYVFESTTHKDIHELIKDSRFLSGHLSNQCGL